MTDASAPDDSHEQHGMSFFDAMTEQGRGAGGAGRVRELKRMLFDLSYLVMNADGTEHISEKMLVQKLERRLEREGSVDVDNRADTLENLLEKGPDAIRDRVTVLAEKVADRAGDRTQELCKGYLDLLKGLIVADANVSPKEYELFDVLCEKWGVENELPRP
jgi:uncharacterized tellurite resistance protein B-like protein